MEGREPGLRAPLKRETKRTLEEYGLSLQIHEESRDKSNGRTMLPNPTEDDMQQITSETNENGAQKNHNTTTHPAVASVEANTGNMALDLKALRTEFEYMHSWKGQSIRAVAIAGSVFAGVGLALLAVNALTATGETEVLPAATPLKK